MVVNKAARTAREATSPQNGLPEPVPYVYRQQRLRNTYAARIAQRNVGDAAPDGRATSRLAPSVRLAKGQASRPLASAAPAP